ncbi:MAG: AI-2E family transporter [Candidatus Pacebacteria bacterium]|nr:AI-2E family transporter [Candidatus Paceibacterota bacterium]
MKQDIVKWDIAGTAIFKIGLAIIIFYLLFLIRPILLWALLALVISIVFNPAVSFLQKRKLPRILSAAIIYFVFLAAVALFFYLIIPPVAAEISSFSQNFSQYSAQISSFFARYNINIQNVFNLYPALNSALLNFSSNLLNVVISVFGSVFAAITIFILAFFFSVEEKDLLQMIRLFSPPKWEEAVMKAWDKSQSQVIGWFGSRILCSIGVAILTFLAALILKIKFAVSLGLLGGLLNIVPVIGPLIIGAILIAVALTKSLTAAVLALVFSIIIQQIEHNVLTPFFTRRMVGIPNFLVLLSILIGGELMGIIGAFLAIPIAGVIYETLKNYSLYQKKTELNGKE